MTTPAEALSSVTDQQQTAFDRERVGEPERQYPGAAKTTPGAQVSSAGDGQPVVESVDELPERLTKGDQAQVKLAHQQELARKRQQRYRQRHLKQVREQNAAHMRKARARQREQGSSAAGRQQPVFDRLAEREGQLPGVQQAQVKPERRDQEASDKQERRRAQNAAAKRRYRERRGDEEKRQEILYKREWRARKRQQPGSFADGKEPRVRTREELERQLAAEREARAERERQLEEERQQRQQAEAKLARQREQARARQQRRRDRNPEQMRKQHTEYMREWRARQRGQDSSAAVPEQPVVDQVSELERRLAEAQTKLEQHEAKLALQQATRERQQEQKRERWRRWRERHAEEDRQRSAAYRRRKRQEREQGRNPST